MLDSIGLGVLGLAVGTFGTLVGAGGGFLLAPALLLLYPGREPAIVSAMSLAVVFGNTASGSAAYAIQRRIDVWSALRFGLATLPGAIAGAIVVGYVPRQAFDALFAAVLIAAGAYLLRPRGTQYGRDPVRGRGVVRRIVRDRRGDTFRYQYRLWHGLAISAGVGFLSSLLGIGGGIIHVPMMVVILHFPVHIATATSHAVLAATALEGTIVHVATGDLVWNRVLAQTALLAAGAVVGAQIGARLAARVHGRLIIRALGVALLLVALRLAVAAALD